MATSGTPNNPYVGTHTRSHTHTHTRTRTHTRTHARSRTHTHAHAHRCTGTNVGTTLYAQSFCKTAPNTVGCPAGYAQINTLADCVTALNDVSAWRPSVRYTLKPAAYSDVPPGCYQWADDGKFYFNSDPEGAASPSATPICKKL